MDVVQINKQLDKINELMKLLSQTTTAHRESVASKSIQGSKISEMPTISIGTAKNNIDDDNQYIDMALMDLENNVANGIKRISSMK